MARRKSLSSCLLAAQAIAFAASLFSAQAAVPEEVSTAAELRSALQRGTPNIVITEHLDLRGSRDGLTVSNETLSIQSNCSSAVPPELAIADVMVQPPRCVLGFDRAGIDVSGIGTWLSQLDLRILRKTPIPDNAPFVTLVHLFGEGSRLWLTQCQMLGDLGPSQALHVDQGAAVYMTEALVAGHRAETFKQSSVYVSGGTAAVVGSNFTANHAVSPALLYVAGPPSPPEPVPRLLLNQTRAVRNYLAVNIIAAQENANSQVFALPDTQRTTLNVRTKGVIQAPEANVDIQSEFLGAFEPWLSRNLANVSLTYPPFWFNAKQRANQEGTPPGVRAMVIVFALLLAAGVAAGAWAFWKRERACKAHNKAVEAFDIRQAQMSRFGAPTGTLSLARVRSLLPQPARGHLQPWDEGLVESPSATSSPAALPTIVTDEQAATHLQPQGSIDALAPPPTLSPRARTQH